MSSDLAVDSRPALMGVFRVLQHGEVCTVDASSAWITRAHCTWNLDIIFTSHLLLIVTWPLFQDCMRRVRDGSVHRLGSGKLVSDAGLHRIVSSG